MKVYGQMRCPTGCDVILELGPDVGGALLDTHCPSCGTQMQMAGTRVERKARPQRKAAATRKARAKSHAPVRVVKPKSKRVLAPTR